MSRHSQKLRAEARKHSLTVEAYLKFFEDRGIDILKEDCYNPIDDTCDGSCQGASDCPIAEEFWSGIRSTPYRMRNHSVLMELNKIDYDKLRKATEEIIDEFKNK